jgi:general stress protein 26
MSKQSITAGAARPDLAELVRAARTCLLTTTAVDGRLVSRPMALPEAQFDGDLWFFAYRNSAKIRQIRVNPQVNVGFSDQRQRAWVSVAGTAQEDWDAARAERLWRPLLATWFPDGPDTPGITLIKVHAGSAEYWDAPGGPSVRR